MNLASISILLVFSISVNAANLVPCLYVNQLIPDPLNCSRFYECTLAGWVGEACNPNLYFNPATLKCDYAWNVQCANESIKEDVASGACGNLTLDQIIPDPQNCSQFIQCSPHGLVKLPCPKTLLFNPDTLQCDYPDNVTCANSSVQQNLASGACGNLSLDQIIPDPQNCSQFIQCSPHGLVKLPCPKTLLFNPDTLQCDYPDNVTCANSSVQQNLASGNCGNLTLDQIIPDPQNCSQFIQCSPLGLVKLPCPKTLLFNPDTLQCDYPDNVTCANSSVKQNLNSGACGNLTLDQIIPDPQNCSQFIQCSPHGLVKLPCPKTLLFNPDTLQCDYPDNVTCANSSVQQKVAYGTCGNLSLDQIVPDPQNCSQFIQCTPEGLVYKACPGILLFNPDTLECDYPDNVTCANSSVQQILKEGSCGNLVLDEIEPDPQNCSQFIQCTPEGLVYKACPGILLFNPDTLECDYPDNVTCANSSVQQILKDGICGNLILDEIEPDPQNCSQYIQCAPQGLVTLPCPKTLLFNPETLQCDYPENVKCANSSVQQTFGSAACEPVGDLQRNPQNCSQFYECTEQGYVLLNCPATLYFNPNTKQCDYARNVECEYPKNSKF
ncbi:hypothetical protein HHI36_002923 [Cryptolaemus montrouzieri]|uniref:Chitin-binding type-2 domain-containing protein n=1 Tax=Cryptolaemus montrouzieri TaxID=559131 RepID=A0ABD2PC91_9CUCU